VLCAGVSHAVVITFDDLEIPGYGYTFLPSYSNSGFTLASSGFFASPYQGQLFYYGSANLMSTYSDGSSTPWTTLTSSGGVFTINSIDVHTLLAESDVELNFYAYLGGTEVDHLNYVIPHQDWDIMPEINWHTVNFGPGFENVTKVKWQSLVQIHSFDNIVLNGSSIVPEPSSILLLSFGLLGAGAVRRRRKR